MHFALAVSIDEDENIPAPAATAFVEFASLEIGNAAGPIRLAVLRTPGTPPSDVLELKVGSNGFFKLDSVTFQPGKPFSIEIDVTRNDSGASPIKITGGGGGASGAYDGASAVANPSKSWVASTGAIVYDTGVKTSVEIDNIAVWVTP
jgi:hypothetical protein